MENLFVWVFNGNQGNYGFPSAVFSTKEFGENWIKNNKLSGTLSRYPIDIPLYEWAISNDYIKPMKEININPNTIANFTSSHIEHYHYEDGK